jgi:hypothetical protein
MASYSQQEQTGDVGDTFGTETADLDGEAGLLLDADSEQQPTLSVVMPTLNEEEGIEECIQRIRSAIAELGVRTEIIISDSSSDRTPEIAEELGAIVCEPDEAGYGYAYRYAFECARGEFIAMGDADTTYDFEELPKLIRRLTEADADMVMGSRLEGEIKPGAMPNLHQYVGNPLLTRFLNTFYDAGVSDAHSGFRVFTRDALEAMDLNTRGMEFASEMIMDASVKGLDIEEVPITYHEREGDATLDSFHDGWRHIKFMLVNAPGYLFSLPGLAMGSLGVLLMGLAFFGYELSAGPLSNQPVGNRTMILGSLLTIVGYQIASKGVFANISGDPIYKQTDKITNGVIHQLSLERAVLGGLVILGAGLLYAGFLIFQWWTSGYGALPGLTHDIVAFTAIIIGLQTVFSAFFMSAVAES